MVRVRFAPSPTGYLHIGSARTALFNWLFARHNKGVFFLRIEDTDISRSKKEYLDEILESLKWLGIEWDGEPVFQSAQRDLYRAYAETLLDKGLAYREGEAIIFKVDKEGEVGFTDVIRGEITVKKEELKDQVLIKSDGSPTYNFACVVDDADMSITHIIRGDDHISNTPKQILLYRALGFAIPEFAHIPLILSKEGGRMSKRQRATSVLEYRDIGYLPEAMINFLSLLGWSPGGDKEIFSVEEAVKLFDLKGVNKTGAVFDIDKLNWLNGQYIMSLAPDVLAEQIEAFLKRKKIVLDPSGKGRFAEVVNLYRERLKTLSDFEIVYNIFFSDTITYVDKAVDKHLKKTDKGLFLDWYGVLEKIDSFDKESLERALRGIADERGVKPAKLIHPTRVAVSGNSAGAGLFEMMEILGKEKVLRRLDYSLKNHIQ